MQNGLHEEGRRREEGEESSPGLWELHVTRQTIADGPHGIFDILRGSDFVTILCFKGSLLYPNSLSI